MKDVVAAKFATSTQKVRRRIASPKFPNWRYAAVDDTGKPIRKPYTLNPGEINYDQWLQQQPPTNEIESF
jgi:hypothetical protein